MLVKELLQRITYSQTKGNTEVEISKVIAFNASNLERNTLMWVNEKNVGKLTKKTKGILICPLSTKADLSEQLTVIFSPYPRRTFKEVLHILYAPSISDYSIADSAFIDKSASIAKQVFIGHNVVIEKNCTLEEGVRIGHNTVLRANTIIKKNTTIGANCTIGGIGFGYEKTSDGNYEQILHIGNVEISENVEVGNNTCIDRAVLGSTKIGKNVKIDNLVHISHGVEIKENALIIANSMVAGSVTIGENSWVAPSSSILNKVSIGNDVTIGLGAIVIRDVQDDDVVVGNPAKSIKRK